MENLSQQVWNEISILNNDTRFESVWSYFCRALLISEESNQNAFLGISIICVRHGYFDWEENNSTDLGGKGKALIQISEHCIFHFP